MKNSSENFVPVFGKEPEENRPDVAEELAVFEEAGSAGRRLEGGEKIVSRGAGGDVSDETSRLRVLRQELVNVAPKTEKGLKPVVPEIAVFKSTEEKLNPKPTGRFRRFVHFALAGLGLLAADKLQAADSKGSQLKPDAIVAGVPVFKAPTQSNNSTNIYKYQGEMWQPKTEAEKEKMQKARAALEAQSAAARTEKSSGTANYGQYQQHGENPAVNVAASPEVNHNWPVNTGHYSTYNDGRFPNTANRQIPNDVVVIQGGGGNYYPEPTYPQYNNNYDMRGRYSNMPMPSTVYYGVPPGGQIPTEKRKLFGKEFEAITRDAALGISGSDRRGGNYPTHNESPRPKKPKSR